jgi:glucose/arabinose dehydrogenase
LKYKHLVISTIIAFFCFGCRNTIPKTVIEEPGITLGKTLFENNCTSCHGFVQNGIGPQLGGLGVIAKKSYIFDMITNAEALINQGHPRAIALKNTYGSAMPSFEHLSEDDRNALVDYIALQPAPPIFSDKYGLAIVDPIPERVELSDLVLKLEHFATIPPSGPNNVSTRIALMSTNPATSETFMADLRGKLYRFNGKMPEVYFDLAEHFPNFIDRPGLATGFGAFAFHPDFSENGLLYTTHTEKPASDLADFPLADSIKVTLQWVLTEWKTETPQDSILNAKPRELFRVEMASGLHGVQEIAFNPLAKKGEEDYGLLYLGIGDGGAVEVGYPLVPHSKNGPWGSLLRIDPLGKNSRNGKYGIPESNPFVKTKDYLGEVYALGFRNPHRFTWTQSGKLLVINIGQKHIESVNLIKPGYDFGWPYREGRFRIDELGDLNLIYKIPTNEEPNKFNVPVIEVDHDDMAAISTALEYTGQNIPSLVGKYIFTTISITKQFYVDEQDIQEGKVAKVREFMVSLDGKIVTFNELTGNPGRADLRIGKDADGELYFFTKPDGKVYKVIP